MIMPALYRLATYAMIFPKSISLTASLHICLICFTSFTTFEVFTPYLAWYWGNTY